MRTESMRREPASSILVLALALATTGCPSPSPSPAPLPVLSSAADASPAPSAPASASATVAAAAAVPSPSSSAQPNGSPYPPVEGTCSKDGDCDIVGTFREGGVGCCTKCQVFTAGTRSWAERARTACHARGPCSLPSSCLAPETPMFVGACSGGACVVKKK